MGSYILFIFGAFEDHEDLEFFCLEHFTKVSESGIKFVIESGGNCVIIFDSEKDRKELIKDVKETLAIEHIKFYLMFEKDKVFFAELPESLSNFIFKPAETNNEDDTPIKIKITYIDTNYDLDEILDKIQEGGVESLTEGEKKFLDEFGK
ncbi:MAG: hypothetical protein RLZ10_469 [Bacteroidota bacterium]|jgi:tRNA(Ser,Leu) C12 N-acetylase TAN1